MRRDRVFSLLWLIRTLRLFVEVVNHTNPILMIGNVICVGIIISLDVTDVIDAKMINWNAWQHLLIKSHKNNKVLNISNHNERFTFILLKHHHINNKLSLYIKTTIANLSSSFGWINDLRLLLVWLIHSYFGLSNFFQFWIAHLYYFFLKLVKNKPSIWKNFDTTDPILYLIDIDYENHLMIYRSY